MSSVCVLCPLGPVSWVSHVLPETDIPNHGGWEESLQNEQVNSGMRAQSCKTASETSMIKPVTVKKIKGRDGPVIKTLCLNAGGSGLIPGQGTRSHILPMAKPNKELIS